MSILTVSSNYNVRRKILKIISFEVYPSSQKRTRTLNLFLSHTIEQCENVYSENTTQSRFLFLDPISDDNNKNYLFEPIFFSLTCASFLL